MYKDQPPTLEFEYLLFMLKNRHNSGNTHNNPAVTKDIQNTLYLRNALGHHKMSYTKILGEAPPIQRCLNQNPSSINPGLK